MHYFLLSHARHDVDQELRRFHLDLEHEVSLLLKKESPVGFRDARDIELGEHWEEKLAEALCQCRVFVFLSSPTYYSREWCGKEWSFFRTRLTQHAEDRGVEAPPLFIPINWIPAAERPECVRQYQYETESLGQFYVEEGLRQLMRRQPRKEYNAVLNTITKTVVAAGQKNRLLPWPDPPIFKPSRTRFTRRPDPAP